MLQSIRLVSGVYSALFKFRIIAKTPDTNFFVAWAGQDVPSITGKIYPHNTAFAATESEKFILMFSVKDFNSTILSTAS
jgi:hypothetical protein